MFSVAIFILGIISSHTTLALFSISCLTTFEDLRLEHANVICPAGCGNIMGVFGSGIFHAQSRVCVAAIHDGRLTHSGGYIEVFGLRGIPWYMGSVKNGVKSETLGEGDVGTNHTAFAFESRQALCTKIGATQTGEAFTYSCPMRCLDFEQVVYGSGTYAINSSLCGAAIHAGRIGYRGGSVTFFQGGPQANFSSSVNNGITSEQSGYQPESFKFTYGISCTTSVESLQKREAAFAVTCPYGCQSTYDMLWGVETYKFDSYICAAAIHDGRITASGGRVYVYQTTTRGPFHGMLRRGITSRPYMADGASQDPIKSFTFEDPSGVCQMSGYNVSLTRNLFYRNQRQIHITCPPGCQRFADKLWGNNLYTIDSSICAAAIHSGKISGDIGGRVRVQRGPPQLYFHSVMKNQIRSKERKRGIWWSFRVVADPL